jgi:beta-lactamase class A
MLQKCLRRLGVSLMLVSTLARPSPPQDRAPAGLQAALHERFEASMRDAARRLDGVAGYAIKDLNTGESFDLNENLVFPTASSIKLTVLLELMRQAQYGTLSLDDKHTIRRSETTVGDDEPILSMLGDGTVTMSLRDIATFMIVLSDNSATNILIDRLGMDNINSEITRVGLRETHLRRKMIDIEAARQGRENVSTPREMVTLMEKVHAGDALDSAHTKDYFALLALPKVSLFHKALPPTVAIEDKPGSLDAVRCDTGIIEVKGHPFAISVMTTYDSNNEEGERAVKEIARLAYEYFSRLAGSSAYGRVISEK